jgi:signal transduction histidine kinase/ligand-binding sensor domain-containing protein
LSGSSTFRSVSSGWRRWLTLSAIFVAVVSGVRAAEARDTTRALSQYFRDRWENDRGFPGGRVYAITQTADGYLWIGAEKGLVRFDGLSFQLFEPDGAKKIGPTVLGVVGAPDGSVWARLRGPGLVRYRNGGFDDILPQLGASGSVVSAMTPGRGGSVLLATVGGGALIYRNGKVEEIAFTARLPGPSFVVSLAQSSGAEFWLGTREAGLLRVSGSQITRVTEGLPDLKVNCLLPGEHGEFWIGTDKGVVRWTGSGLTRTGIPAALHAVPAVAMMRDSASNVWISAGSKGLLRVDRRGTVDASDLAQASTAFEDREGNIWIGTDRGIERWRDPVFTTYSVRDGLPSETIGPVFASQSGETWFAPISGGLYRLRDGVVTAVTEAGLATDVIYSIAGNNRDTWVGRQRGGLTRIRAEGDGWSATRFTHADGLAQNSVYAVHQARDGSVWAGTLNSGASRLKDGSFSSYDTRQGLASNTVSSIADTTDGTVWFGTPTGLSSLSGTAWRTFTVRDGLPSNDVSTLLEDAAGNLWVGTAAGLAVVRSGRVHPLLLNEVSILSGSILGIAEDRRGTLWIATADRIVRVRRARLLEGRATRADLREYLAADGLLGLEGVKRHRTVVADAGGRIWFALNRGLSVADPTRADARQEPALTHVEAVAVDGAPVDLGHAVSIPSSHRRVTFSYAGLSLSTPERVRFRYRLDPFDGDWSEPVAAREAVYTNLRPAEYRFRVIASNSDGLWNGSEATLAFEIRPALWQTAWFQAAVLALAGLAGWGAYRLRVRQVAKQLHIRFEERLAERTRIAQELHDTLLQGFVSASMQLHVAVSRLPADSPAMAPLTRVLELMRSVTEEGRNAVRGLRAAHRTDELETAFSQIQQEFPDSRATFRVVVEGPAVVLGPAIRDEVYRIGREALLNAFRHSSATRIEIELEYTPTELRMFVRDDGKGIDEQVVHRGSEGHWGLTGMHERAERIGATLKIRSRAGAGTEVELRVPARLAFDRAAPGRRRSWVSKLLPWGRGVDDDRVEKPS